MWDGLRASRTLRWEVQVGRLLEDDLVSDEDVRRYLADHELILYDEVAEWKEVNTPTGLRRWLSRRAGDAPNLFGDRRVGECFLS